MASEGLAWVKTLFISVDSEPPTAIGKTVRFPVRLKKHRVRPGEGLGHTLHKGGGALSGCACPYCVS